MLKPLTIWITTSCKILKELGIPDHLTCLLRNLYTGQEATVRTGYWTIDWFQIGKGVLQGCILSPCLFNFYTEYLMWNARLDEAQARIKTTGRNINNLRYADGIKQRRIKEPLDESERGEWKSWLKTQHSKTWDHAFGPSTSWQVKGEKVEAMTKILFGGWGSKIIADGDCSHEI